MAGQVKAMKSGKGPVFWKGKREKWNGKRNFVICGSRGMDLGGTRIGIVYRDL